MKTMIERFGRFGLICVSIIAAYYSLIAAAERLPDLDEILDRRLITMGGRGTLFSAIAGHEISRSAVSFPFPISFSKEPPGV
ncbi:MAG: hypothetical protein PHR28_05835 [candidate division Zixibacteria bacterium]|nr:hypothetical protein [candidate division Zixibacteria bacterium]